MSYLLRDSQGREYPIAGQTRIGREAGTGIALADPLISRHHATVWEQGGALFVRDENSSNGTFVNGKRISEVQLHAGDQIRVGESVLTVAESGAQRTVKVQQKTAQPAQGAQKKGRGCGCWLLAGCLGLALAIVVALGGGYLAYRAGWITLDDLLRVVGLGPASIEVDNFRDDTIQVSIEQIVEDESTPVGAAFELNAFDIHNFQTSQPGRYRVDFGTETGGSDLGSCTLTVKSGGQYQFVALPDMIAVNDVNHPPASGPDLIVDTSSLCR